MAATAVWSLVYTDVSYRSVEFTIDPKVAVYSDQLTVEQVFANIRHSKRLNRSPWRGRAKVSKALRQWLGS